MDNLNNRTDQPIYLIFLGPPGSGKGTQADSLRAKFGLVHLSSGDLFRENISKGTPLGQKVKDILAHGDLVPDDLTLAMVMDRLGQPDTERGVVFDGFPRTREQAVALQQEFEKNGKHIDAVIYFHVDEQVIIERLSARRVCPKDGMLYNLLSKPPERDELCDLDGERLVLRNDDRPEVVSTRLEVYHQLTEPLVKFFDEQDLLYEIDASQSIPILESKLEKFVAGLIGDRAQVA